MSASARPSARSGPSVPKRPFIRRPPGIDLRQQYGNWLVHHRPLSAEDTVYLMRCLIENAEQVVGTRAMVRVEYQLSKLRREYDPETGRLRRSYASAWKYVPARRR